MNMNRLSLISDEAGEKQFARHQPQEIDTQEIQRREITLSDIAARLRSVHEQMKTKTPVKSENVMPFPQKNNDDVKAYLDDIARALLKEYEARKTEQSQLVRHLARIEQILEANKQELEQSAEKDRQALTNAIAGEVHSRLKQELTEQTKSLADESRKTNQEISRQLREAAAASRFSVQLVSLQRQITNLQATLDAYDKSPTSCAHEEKSEHLDEELLSTTSPQQLPASDSGQNHLEIKKSFDKPVIRILAEKKTPEQTSELNKTPVELDKCGREDEVGLQKCEIGDSKLKTDLQKCDSETVTQLNKCGRAAKIHEEKVKVLRAQNGDNKTKKTITRVSALLLMVALAYGLKEHFAMLDNASVVSLLH